ncbi:unnamed protein product [Leuciscus chuanchicus]
MVKCAVQGCINHSDLRSGEQSSRPRKRFFRFPKDKARVKVWLAALRETEREITDQHQICEDHFLSHHITPNGISPDAIPIMPQLEGPVCGWSSCDEQDEHLDPVGESGVAADDDDDDDDSYDEEFEDDDEEEDDDEDHSGAHDAQEQKDKDKTQGQCFTGSNPNIYFAIPTFNMNQANSVSTAQVQNRSEVALGQLTKRFMQLLHTAPNGVLDLNEVSRKLGTRKRRVYDITNVLTGIHLIKKTSKNKIQWIIRFTHLSLYPRGPGAVSSTGNQWSPKTKADLLNLNCTSAYVTYEDICKIGVFKDQTIIAVRAPEETKLEVPTPTEESIQIHLKGSRGPIHILTCETEGPSDAVDPANTESQLVRPAYFLTLEESRIHTQPLISERRKKWMRNIRREGLSLTSHTRVCSRHFKSDDVKEPSTPKGRRRLKKDAVPTLFQWNNFSASEPLQKRAV